MAEWVDVLERVLEKVVIDVRHLTGNADAIQREAALISLSKKIEISLKNAKIPLNHLIFNMEEKFIDQLETKQYFDVNIYGKIYGVWLFEQGTFENLGRGTSEHWKFCCHPFYRREGDPVKLYKNPRTLCTTWVTGEGRKVVFEKPKLD